MRHIARSLCLALALVAPAVLAQPAWPTIALPDGVQRYDMGQQMTVNGLPLRMSGFLSPQPPTELAAWFRAHMGKVVENTVAGKLVLGRAEGSFFLTVQLEAVGRGTRGLVAVSNLKAGYEHFPETEEALSRLLARLPAGSRILSQMASTENGKLSRYLVISNGLDVGLNRSQVIDMMREDGMVLQQEAQPAARTGQAPLDGRTMFFQGQGREAMAVVSHGPDGLTTLVLHTLTAMEHFR